MKKSKIEWTDQVWNPIVGCTPVSEGCRNCYAMRMAARLAHMNQRAYQDVVQSPDPQTYHPKWNGKLVVLEEKLTEPLRWKKPRRVFVNSMSDLFHEDVPFEFINKVFAVMALTPQHTYQVLTKRPERMAEYLSDADRFRVHMACEALRLTRGADYGSDALPLPNVWLGTSVEDQATANERIPHLLLCPAVVRFLSCEPLLGPIDYDRALTGQGFPISLSECIHWVIVGGESGPKARPCDVAWIRSIVQQCGAACVPVFVKQLGSKPIETSQCLGVFEDTEADGMRIRRIARGMACKVKDNPDMFLRDRKGGDPSEWPADLRVRQFPNSLPPADRGNT